MKMKEKGSRATVADPGFSRGDPPTPKVGHANLYFIKIGKI